MNKEWISVDDDLPRVGEAVIFCTKMGTWCGCLDAYTEGAEFSWWAVDDVECIEGVTHWMPYPDPYYEE